MWMLFGLSLLIVPLKIVEPLPPDSIVLPVLPLLSCTVFCPFNNYPGFKNATAQARPTEKVLLYFNNSTAGGTVNLNIS